MKGIQPLNYLLHIHCLKLWNIASSKQVFHAFIFYKGLNAFSWFCQLFCFPHEIRECTRLRTGIYLYVSHSIMLTCVWPFSVCFQNRSDLYDILVNVHSKEISVASHAKGKCSLQLKALFVILRRFYFDYSVVCVSFLWWHD